MYPTAHWRFLCTVVAALHALPVARAQAPYSVEPMRKVHAQFKGDKGTFGQFGDSITVTMAFWSPLAYELKNPSPELAKAQELVKKYMKPDCWSKWKGGAFGSDGGMTIPEEAVGV
jgi:hypothetical protein